MSDIIGAALNSGSVMDNGAHELHRHSRFLRKIAWIVEIIVVFIGLCISISLVAGGDNMVSSFTLSAPFVMISLVELTKIPFVIGLWHSKKSFVMYLLIICFLSLITFETLLNGFERAFSSINSQINLSEIEISRIENQIEVNNENIQIAFQNFSDKTEKIASDKNNVYSSYKARYSSAVKRNERLSKNVQPLRSSLAKARKELNQLKVEKSALLQELSAKKEQRFQSSMKNFQGSADTIKQERARLLGQINALTAEKKQALDDANFFTSATVKKDYDEKIRYAENQLNSINNRTITGESKKPNLESVKFLDDYYAELLALKDDMIKHKSQQVESLSRSYKQAANASSQNLAKRQRQLSKEKRQSLLNLENKLERVNSEFSNENDYIKELKLENTKLRYDIRVIEIEANTMALSNQVYRMASYVDNVSHYKEIKNETLTLVGLIWFGSLALIGSITGIALTLSGLHLSNLAGKQNKKAKVISEKNADSVS
ncbi:hypothetical protein [Psychromonas aquimarina]|uniref:hypothetical protein n=1 Tax=Psychromonas aquimarina TaxID=444919 RepID=UPI0004283BBF|nr:hypothetical protein [Psychromonas aquimarina]